MNAKFKLLAVFFTVAVMAVFTSCDKDNDVVPKPTISKLELGLENSKVAYIGSDLHIEAEIVAEGKIKEVKVEIHQEEGSGEEIEAKFDDYNGQKNATFHKHVDIPSTAKVGVYHCHITVTDMEGNSTMVEDEITLKELEDKEKPVLTISTSPEDGAVYTKDKTITISGKVSDNNSLAGMVVGLVYKSDNLADADVTGAAGTKVIVMLHTHDFDSPKEHSFTASIKVGAEKDNNMTPAAITGENAWKSGNYYLLVKCKDAKNNWVISKHYPIVVNL